MTKKTILVVDDEKQIVELVTSYLLKEGYHVLEAYDGIEVFPILQRDKVDLIVLDVMMPGMDGYTACEKIREKWTVPIIMLTAKGGEMDRVQGLKIGADDYVVKPFSPKELVARIEAQLRRIELVTQKKTSFLRFGALEIDLEGRTVTVEDKKVTLTRKEYDLLQYLVSHEKMVFSREQIHDYVWGMDYEKGTFRTVDTHIKTLRIKLGQYGNHIKTVWGVGYKFEGDNE
ncbi:response regulator transcription factor [Alkalihalobacterium elongatum]|uniref:response regulator transcription factor n=1 Tax=Alkalihalobacterium elongatum TaxID=2675466 RepID=UPI001C1F986C|nr:response regulator transcription factor [Alkalihalobacterium elongatum]